MPTPRSRRLGVRGLATALVAAITLTGLGACGADNPGRDGRGPRTPRGQSTSAEATSSESPSVDPSGTAGSTSTATASPPPTTTEAPKPKSVKITIKAGDVKGAPARLQVSVGQAVRIAITSDVADELHVHGVEQTLALPAAQKVELEFVVPPELAPGQYAVELHGSGLLLFALEVR